MKDSKNKLEKSSSESKILEPKIIPPMPKDKRTKEYKEWYKKYGEIKADTKVSSVRKTKTKKKSLKQIKEVLVTPPMPKDKRTKQYKEWHKKYGEAKGKTETSSSTKKKESKVKKSIKLKDLVSLFNTKVESENWIGERKEIEDIKNKIEVGLKKEYENEKKKFNSTKENEQFIFKSDNKIQYQKTLKNYSFKKRKHYSEIGAIQKANLEKRLELIEKIKDLIVIDIKPNNLYKTFKTYKESWHNIGQVPITERNDIWETYRHHTEKFYDFLHLNRELRELDYKHNYEEKIKLIEKAEALDKIKNVMQASRDLNILHRLWKNELGPVSKEHREGLWGRFQKASNKIHAKRQEHQKEINSKQNENFLKKEKVLSKMRGVLENVPNSHNEWQNKIKIFNNLKDEFQKIRNIPKKKNKISWNQFRTITKEFNNKKNSFYKNQKNELKQNIDKKKSLIEEVKNILKLENHSENSKRVIEIQNEWKKVGYIPRKISNSLWQEFKQLCNTFFNNLKSRKNKISNKEKKSINIDKEKQSLKRRISQLQDESNQFENNLEYFTNSSSDNPLFKNVSSKLTSINDQIEVLKGKLNKIKQAPIAEAAPADEKAPADKKA